MNELNIDGYSASNINTPDFTSEEITKKAYLMNLELNFVHNNRLAHGDHRTAALYFEHVVNKYPEHAFAHYFLAKCLSYKTSGTKKARYHSNKFQKILQSSVEWRYYATYFNLI